MKKKTETTPGRTEVHEWTLNTPSGKATLSLAQKGRRYTVTDFTVHSNPDLCLGFAPTGPGIENMDVNSDSMQVFYISTEVKVDGVYLSTLEMRANSPEELKAALEKVRLRPFLREAI
jgi:hypothetical protein